LFASVFTLFGVSGERDMAHTKSTRKRIRQSRKRHLRNQAVQTRLRGLTRKFHASLKEPDPETVKVLLRDFSQAVDKAASKGILHKRTASRKTSRLAKATHRQLTASSGEDKAAAP
jgi:small subunit ribosomal protein S20